MSAVGSPSTSEKRDHQRPARHQGSGGQIYPVLVGQRERGAGLAGFRHPRLPAAQATATAALAAASPTTVAVPAGLEAALALNRPGSQKDTRHVVFDLKDTGIDYEAGDALGL